VKICAEPNCPNLTTSTRCETHRKALRRKHDKRRPTARQRGYNAQWERTRRDYLTTFPICQWHEGCLSPAVDVHHIDGQGPKGERGHDWSNLMGLCHPHHSKVTATEQAGGWNA
jgi:5-methylcytosine-specific restriction protein A